ncbi:MAG: hypothetical protein IAG10_19965 [Planctomycetaceae bacterium]|nr:hypothetical protein [Planctomycetaceae bacterium]
MAGPQSVLAPFENVHLQSRGRTYDLERRGNEYWITMSVSQADRESQAGGKSLPADRPPRATTKKVVLTTGSHIAQTYWISSGKGLLQVPWMYHLEEQRWIPDEDSFLLPPDSPSVTHQWNTNCVKCHTSAPRPGMTKESGFRTQVAELGIACEACHGPGEAHVRFREDLKSQPAASVPNLDQDPITNPARTSPSLASQICAQCHSSHREADLGDWLANGSRFRPGEELEKKVRMHRHNTPETKADYEQGYWADGTCRTGGDEYLGLTTSKCFEGGKLSCLSCHSMHRFASTTDQLRPQMDGNQACLQCHEDMRDKLQEHTHHAAQSSGSLCMNCHMPHITYALFKGIRSHRIDSPSAAVSAMTGRPAACNLCHLDKPLGWTADKLTEWYGQPAVELTDQQTTTSATVTMALQGDAAQRVIAAWHLGWEPARQASREDWQAPFLAYLLDDPYSVVRYVSYRSLKKLPGYEEFLYDFVITKERREQGKNQALRIWQTRTHPAFGELGNSILMNQEGQLDIEAAEEILKKRDNRRIAIPE